MLHVDSIISDCQQLHFFIMSACANYLLKITSKSESVTMLTTHSHETETCTNFLLHKFLALNSCRHVTKNNMFDWSATFVVGVIILWEPEWTSITTVWYKKLTQ